jgi:vacuolar-type H+-ATPase subunit I/STV1
MPLHCHYWSNFMRRSIWLLVSVLVLSTIGTIAVREVSVRASQPLTPEAESVALDPMEKSDQMTTPDCAQLTRLAMRAEVNALGVQFASQSEPQALHSNVAELQSSVQQMQSFRFNNQQVDRLRTEYATLLQQLLQSAKADRPLGTAAAPITQQVQQVTRFNREQILFNRCHVSSV